MARAESRKRARTMSLVVVNQDCSEEVKIRRKDTGTYITSSSCNKMMLTYDEHEDEGEDDEEDDDGGEEENEVKEDALLKLCDSGIYNSLGEDVHVECVFKLPQAILASLSKSNRRRVRKSLPVGEQVPCDPAYETEEVDCGLLKVKVCFYEAKPEEDQEGEEDPLSILLIGVDVSEIDMVAFWSGQRDRVHWIAGVLETNEQRSRWWKMLAFCRQHQKRPAKSLQVDELKFLANLCVEGDTACDAWTGRVETLLSQCPEISQPAFWCGNKNAYPCLLAWEKVWRRTRGAPASIEEDCRVLRTAFQAYTENKKKDQLEADRKRAINSRRVVLVSELAKHGAVIREDSAVCRAFIEQTPWRYSTIQSSSSSSSSSSSTLQLEQAVQIVVDTKFLYEKTDYAQRMNQAMSSRRGYRVEEEDGSDSDGDNYYGSNYRYQGYTRRGYWHYDESVDQIRKRCKLSALDATLATATNANTTTVDSTTSSSIAVIQGIRARVSAE